jgi:hypothetical protein
MRRRPPLIPLETRATLVTAVFASIVIAAVVSAWSDWTLIDFLKHVGGHSVENERLARTIDARQRWMGIIQTVSRLVGAFVFLSWFHAAHKNLGSSGLERLTYSPASAIYGFFIPILSLFRPYQVMAEVSRGSTYLSGESGAATWRSAPEGPVVGLWWGLYLAAQIAGLFATRLPSPGSDIGTLVTAGWMSLASDVLDAPAAIAAVLLVRTISRQQAAAREYPVAEVFE